MILRKSDEAMASSVSVVAMAMISSYIIQICSGIASGRVLDGELLYTILEVNLFAFAYRLFHEDFSSITGVLGWIYLVIIMVDLATLPWQFH